MAAELNFQSYLSYDGNTSKINFTSSQNIHKNEKVRWTEISKFFTKIAVVFSYGTSYLA